MIIPTSDKTEDASLMLSRENNDISYISTFDL